jgi:hypothetical protein
MVSLLFPSERSRMTMVTIVLARSNVVHTLRLRIESCIQTITIAPSGHWLAELSNTCTRASHGISSRKSVGFFKAGSQGDLLFGFPLTRLRSGLSLHTSASASLKVRDARGAVLHQGNISLTLTLRYRMSTRAVILTMR